MEEFMKLILEKLTHIEDRLTKIETRLERVEERLDKVEKRLDAVEGRLETLEEEVKFLGRKLDLTYNESALLRQDVTMIKAKEDNFFKNLRKMFYQ